MYRLLIILLFVSACSHQDGAMTSVQESENVATTTQKTWTKSDVVFSPLISHEQSPQHKKSELARFCKKLQKSFDRYGWGESECESVAWGWSRVSNDGDPLIYTMWGDQDPDPSQPVTTTLIMCGVHGDEITPIKLCFDVISMLQEVQKSRPSERNKFRNKRVVVAPIVSPDAYFKRYPSRTNANGVDINRNFPTRDWRKDALRLWVHRYGKDKRRYPGPSAASESETLFQVDMISSFTPGKIISVHSPLTMLDYDGPENLQTGGEVGNKASQLLIQMSRKAKDYRIKDYPFFPGSLGNYAGNERGIPTFTLELPSSDNRLHRKYWNQFQGAIRAAIIRDLNVDYDVAGERDNVDEATLN